MIRFLDIITILCTGLMIGVELAVSVFINPVLRKLDNGTQSEAIRLFARRLGKAMPLWYIGSLLLLVGGTIAHRHSAGEFLLVVAGALWIAVIALTLLVLVPINNRMMHLEAGSLSPETQGEHDKWDSLHRLRVVALAIAMACFLVGVQV